MSHSFEGTTLALQHYYDIFSESRHLPLLTVYQASEQPFGRKMAVWMAAYGNDIPVRDCTRQRLDDAMLKNRAVEDPHAMNVLDCGSSEGCSFVVTDALPHDCVSLHDYIRAHGPIEIWKALRILEQLTGIVTAAHRANFRDLCLTSDIIYIRDPDRMDIITGPLGIGLHRSDLLRLRDIPISHGLVRHIAPWEYADAPANDKNAKKSQRLNNASTSELYTKDLDDNSKNHLSDDNSLNKSSNIINTAAENLSEFRQSKENTAEDHRDNDANDASDAFMRCEESIQTLASEEIHIDECQQSLEFHTKFCADLYNMAAIVYEALCGQHPVFSDDRDMCDAALNLVKGDPVNIAQRVEIADEINDAVMDTLRNPIRDGEVAFLSRFAAACTECDRENGRRAEKFYLAQPKAPKPERRRRHPRQKLNHPFMIIGTAAVALMLITAIITYRIASVYEPADLFAIPEIVPAAQQDGIDVVITAHAVPPNTSIYLTSIADGSLIRLGTLPFIYRNQKPDARIRFVIADESGHSIQVPVTVSGSDGLMIVPVDLNW